MSTPLPKKWKGFSLPFNSKFFTSFKFGVYLLVWFIWQKNSLQQQRYLRRNNNKDGFWLTINHHYDGHDDAYCGDIYLDHNVLNSASFFDLSRIFNDAVDALEDDSTHIHKYFKTRKGDVFDFDQLNQVHFFSDNSTSCTPNNELVQPGGNQPSIFADYAAKIATYSKFDITLTNEEDLFSRPLLIIIRHGKTEHNQLGLFTGWEDAMLATEGRHEAIHAGKLLRKHGVEFDVVYTSWLSRAIDTAWLVLNELDSLWLPIVKTWRLNERMYGALTGLSKKMIRQIYGDEQFMKWRRGFEDAPPPISSFSSAYPGNDNRYVNLAHGKFELHKKFPKSESLKDCMERTIPYFLNIISPTLSTGKSVLIASSENAIRGLLMHLCKIPTSKIHMVEIPTGLPLVYDWKQGKLRLLEDPSLGGVDHLLIVCMRSRCISKLCLR
eukprot:gene424-458_t